MPLRHSTKVERTAPREIGTTTATSTPRYRFDLEWATRRGKRGGSAKRRVHRLAADRHLSAMTHPQPTAQNAVPAADADPDPAAALGRIPSGLFVVAWRQAGEDRALLASWIMQAGFTPPAISLAVAATRDLLGQLDAGTAFVVNVLGESQRSLVGRFAKPASDPFTGLDVRRTGSGIAVLADAAAWLECRPVARAAAGGDHVVVVAEVLGAAAAENRSPLVHTRKNGLRY